VKAIVLAAGRGRRLEGDRPKCLLDVGGRSLLERMLRRLEALGVGRVVLVVGYEAERIRAAVAGLDLGLEVAFVENPEFARGSVLSLWAAREHLDGGDDAVVMDADVLFPRPLLRRLLESPRPSAFLLDPSAEAGGEEMMLAARGGRVIRIARRVDPAGYDRLGEGVGFLKVQASDQAALREAVGAFVDAGEVDRDYEDAVDRFLGAVEVGYEETGGLPWTEIDFAKDLARARAEVLPAVERAEAEA